jgi:hypothetical protein
MVAATATLVSTLSVAAAVISLLAYLYSLRRTEQTAAREEALALAETRGQMVAELRERIESLERRNKRAKASYEKRIHELERTLELTRRQARKAPEPEPPGLGVLPLLEALVRIRADLEQEPANVEAALGRIRALLTEDELRSRVG